MAPTGCSFWANNAWKKNKEMDRKIHFFIAIYLINGDALDLPEFIVQAMERLIMKFN
ncbi:MAG: hypothetical protein ACXVLF_00680 [Flavisolibacter sp.]